MQASLSAMQPFRPHKWLIFFIGIHLLLWTFIPTLVRYNLPLDSVEGATWGHQLEWGYDKNPFLNGWLTALATFISQQADWSVYLFSQLSVAICFWAVWKLASNMLPSVYALLSVVILEGIQYYNVHAIDFNDNTLELGLWALIGYYFYLALRQPNYRHWLLTGLFAGLGMMTKYYTAALLAGMAIFLFINKNNRQQLATKMPYAGLLVFIAIVLPHAIWLTSHDYVTLQYMFDRAHNVPRLVNHVLYPWQFIWAQTQALLPAVVLYALLFIGKKPAANELTLPPITLAPFDCAFLFWVAIAPFLLTLLLSVIFGITLRGGWGTPLLSWFGILIVAYKQPHLSVAKLQRFFAVILLLISLSLAGYSYSLIDSDTPSSANFPGREVAQTITNLWHDAYGTPLHFVAGSRWVGGNIGLYSQDRPAVFLEWNKQHAPWINSNNLREQGGVFVWEITGDESLPVTVQQQFPTLTTPIVIEFDWHRNRQHLPPIKIGVAFLPPDKHFSYT